jgi:hypothetical protein
MKEKEQKDRLGALSDTLSDQEQADKDDQESV